MNKEKYEWEHKVMGLINLDNVNNCSVHFDYDTAYPMKSMSEPPMLREPVTVVSVITHNPKNDVDFLLITGTGKTELDAIKDAYNVLKGLKTNKEYHSYTVEWSKKGNTGILKSYFYAKDEYEVLEKFHFGTNKDEVVFYSMTKNPVA